MTRDVVLLGIGLAVGSIAGLVGVYLYVVKTWPRF